MANTATLWPKFVSIVPKDSINVLLPAPGIPVIPIRKLLPLSGRHSCIIF